MKGVNLQRVPDGNGRSSPLCLTMDIGYLLDSMDDQARKEFVGYAVENGELLKILCYHISGHKVEPHEYPLADVWLGQEAIGNLRAALSPLLGDAVAEELRLARERADRFEKAHDHLRSLAHIMQMIREAQMGENLDLKLARKHQWDYEWEFINKMFPEYAPKNAAALAATPEAGGGL